jgi:alpha-tubulin suppressor-like RCC1 family protein
MSTTAYPFLFHSQCAKGLGHAAVIADGWIAGTYAARTVICWGLNDQGQCDVPPHPGGLLPQFQVVQVACGSKHTLSLQLGGFVQAWGWNNFGQSDVPPSLRDYGAGVGRIAAGAFHSIAAHYDGSLTCWGAGSASDGQDNNYRCGQSNPPAGLGPVIDVAAGGLHTVALRADGTVACWGAGGTEQTFNFNMRQSIVPPDLGHCVRVAAGAYSTAALTTSGSVRVWGWMQHVGQCDGRCDVRAPLGTVRGLWPGFWGTVIHAGEPRPECAADVGGSCSVDGVDLGILLAAWGPQPPGTPADLNEDGAVDGIDLGLLLAAWGPCPG